jgi:hypothetical protein
MCLGSVRRMFVLILDCRSDVRLNADDAWKLGGKVMMKRPSA